MSGTTERAVILNVGDDEASRSVVTRTLRGGGYEVVEAATGVEAFRLLVGARVPDLVVLDVHLPDLLGFEIARRVKSNPATAPIPIMFVSATRTDSASVAEGLESGAEAFLSEPVEARVLLAQVRRLLWVRHLQAGLVRARREAELRADQLQTSQEALASAVEELHVSEDALRVSQEDLLRQQALLQSVIDSVPGLVWVKDREGRFLTINTQLERLRRPPCERTQRQEEEGLFPRLLVASHRAQERRVLETGVSELVEEVIPLADGNHSFLVTAFPLPDAKGRPYAVGRVAVDITGQRRTEATSRDSAERYRELSEHMSEGFVLFDRVMRGAGRLTEWRYLAVNPAYEAMTGLAAPELIGKLLGEVLPGVDEQWLEALGRVARSGESEVLEGIFSPTGRWYRTSFHSPGLGYVAAIIADVTRRKQAEEALEGLVGEVEARVAARTVELQESEERFRAFVTATSDVVYRMSPDWSEMRYLQGQDFLPDTEQPSRTWLEKYIHPDDQPHVLAAIQEAVRARRVLELEHRVLRADGTVGWTFSRAIPLLDANGEIVEWFGTASDITARKQAEEALQRLAQERE